jgi:hypothetical protein
MIGMWKTACLMSYSSHFTISKKKNANFCFVEMASFEAVRHSLATIQASSSCPDDLNRANGVLMSFRARPDAMSLCVQVLGSDQQDTLMLHFATSTLCDLFSSSVSVAHARYLLVVVCGRFARPRHVAFSLALQRLCGKVVVLMLSDEWPACLSDCLALMEKNREFVFGVLQHVADLPEKLLVAKAATLFVARLQESAAAMCTLCLNAFSVESLIALEAWVRVGAIPTSVLVPSGLVERVVAAVNMEQFSEAAIDVLSEIFAPSLLGSFRTARSVAKTSFAIDLPKQGGLVLQVLGELLRVQTGRRTVVWASLVCDIIRQHPSLLMKRDNELQKQLMDFLFHLLSNPSIEWASQSVPVWVSLEQSYSCLNAPDPYWKAVFGRATGIALQSASARPGVDEDSLQLWREQLQDLVLSCGQAIGVDVFFANLNDVPLEIALWGTLAVQCLHDGKTPFCLPKLFDAVVNLSRPVSLSIANVACSTFGAYRVFLREFAGGMLVSKCARFCGACLGVAPVVAANSLLRLSETCGSALCHDLQSIAPFVMRAMQNVDSETVVLLLCMCGELTSNLEEAVAAPVIGELLDHVLLLGLPKERSEEQLSTCALACIGFCEHSEGKCGFVYAQRLARAWPRLAELTHSSDEVCQMIVALAVASGSFGSGLLPVIANHMVVVGSQRNCCGAAVEILRAFVVLNECNDSLLNAFGDCLSRFAKLLVSTPDRTEGLSMLFDAAKRAQWNPVWREAMSRCSANQRMMEVMPHIMREGYGSKLRENIAAFEEALYSNANHNTMPLILAAAPMLVSVHITEGIKGFVVFFFFVFSVI